MCGEKCVLAFLATYVGGSPPRVRGKEQSITISLNFVRITPACAGKSGHFSWSAVMYGDHPRVCGEKRFLLRVLNAP